MSKRRLLADGTTFEIVSDESPVYVMSPSGGLERVQPVELSAADGCIEQTAEATSEDMIVYMSSGNDDGTSVKIVEDVQQADGNLSVVTGADGQTVVMSESSAATNVISGDGDNGGPVELIQLSSLSDMSGTDNKVWRILPTAGLGIGTDAVVIVDSGAQSNITRAPVTATVTAAGPSGDPATANLGVIKTRVIQKKPPPDDAPQWARLINDCEKIAHYYRGWVPTEQDLDIILTLHKQQTGTFWGTRQSTDMNKTTPRLMWKSQYVPYDGIPFVNYGSRAMVMECQYGPRRRGAKPDPNNQQSYLDYKQTCPARIYVKKVKKYTDFAIPLELDKKAQKVYMDRAFQSLRTVGCEANTEERYYMQLPLTEAHEYHTPDAAVAASSRYVHHHITKTYNLNSLHLQDSGGNRLVQPVANKIRELVSSGIQEVVTVRRMLRKWVERDLFANREAPLRHDLSYFPTVPDLKNHIHTALTDIENGTLPLREARMDTLALGQEDWQTNWVTNIEPHPETVTVTLTQTDSESGHMISKVETHMSDGSTQISTSLTAETAALLVKCNPNLFPAGTITSSGDITTSNTTDTDVDTHQESQQKITSLVQSVLTKTATVDTEAPQVSEVTEEQKPAAVTSEADHTSSSIHKEASEPAPPTEGVQLDLGISESHHAVAEVILDGCET